MLPRLAWHLAFAAAAIPAWAAAPRAVHGLDLAVGPATLRLEDGFVVPIDAGEPPREFVFAGRGILRARPPDDVEAGQLQLFTGSATLDAPVSLAAFAVADPEVARSFLGGELATPPPEALAEAAAWGDSWRASTERRSSAVDAALRGAAVGDVLLRGYVAVRFRSESLGDGFALFDASEREPFQVGRFAPIALGDHDADLARQSIARLHNEGRLVALRFEDRGDWDTWMRFAPGAEGGPRFECTAYRIDVTVGAEGDRLAAEARVTVRPLADGLRVLEFDLSPDLDVAEVADASKRRLESLRRGSAVSVVLAEPSRRGEAIDLTFRYAGTVLDRDGYGTVWLRSPDRWYPRGGEGFRAAFDVTIRRPKRWDLVASGELVDVGERGGLTWERRVIETPADGFAFEVGSFDVVRDTSGTAELVVAFERLPRSLPSDVRTSVVAMVKDVLAAYRAWYGEIPLEPLTVAVVPRSTYSSGAQAFVALPRYLFSNWDSPRPAPRRSDAWDAISRALAYQWWGHHVAFRTYRDRWLCDALAERAAVRFNYHRLGDDRAYLIRVSRRWRSWMERYPAGGRRIEEFGPVVLGYRLSSSVSAGAFGAVVHGKGSLVLSTLARELGERQFLAALKNLSASPSGRTLDTAGFLDALESASGRDLSLFERQFVLGTAVPEIDYGYDIAPASGGAWVVKGWVRADTTGPRRVVLSRREGAPRWDVTPSRGRGAPLEIRRLTVPWRARLSKDAERETFIEGSVTLDLPEGAFEVTLDQKPERFRLDPSGVTYSWFWHPGGEDDEPAAVLSEGERAFDRGRLDEAEARLRRVLALPDPEDRDDAADAQACRARAHLLLAVMRLDAGRDDDARGELAAAEEALVAGDSNRFAIERVVLRARLDVRAGAYEKAYDELAQRLRLRFRQRSDESIAETARRNKFADGVSGPPEAYALLAVAARETGRGAVAAQAREEADRRGADMSAWEPQP